MFSEGGGDEGEDVGVGGLGGGGLGFEVGSNCSSLGVGVEGGDGVD